MSGSGDKEKIAAQVAAQMPVPMDNNGKPVEVPTTLPSYLYSGGAYTSNGSMPGQNEALAAQMAAGGYGSAAEWAPRLAALSTTQTMAANPAVDPRVIKGSQFEIDKAKKAEMEAAAKAAMDAYASSSSGKRSPSRGFGGGMINSFGQLADVLGGGMVMLTSGPSAGKAALRSVAEKNGWSYEG